MPLVFGAPSRLLGVPLDEPIQAGSQGAPCLLISRANFHTIMSERLLLMMGLMRDAPFPEPAVAR